MRWGCWGEGGVRWGCWGEVGLLGDRGLVGWGESWSEGSGRARCGVSGWSYMANLD